MSRGFVCSAELDRQSGIAGGLSIRAPNRTASHWRSALQRNARSAGRFVKQWRERQPQDFIVLGGAFAEVDECPFANAERSQVCAGPLRVAVAADVVGAR